MLWNLVAGGFCAPRFLYHRGCTQSQVESQVQSQERGQEQQPDPTTLPGNHLVTKSCKTVAVCKVQGTNTVKMKTRN